MSETAKWPTLVNCKVTRRRALAGFAIALGAVATGASSWAQAQETAHETPCIPANQKRTSLHQEVVLKATAQRIYEILLDSKQFAAFTRMPADIEPAAGGAFSMFQGMIVGRNVELVPSRRIVQAWRPADWEPGVYSIVRFELKPQGRETMVVLDHTGFPEGEFDSLSSGWKSHYWDQLQKYLA